jgi:HlyD family secretion protein
MCVPKTCRLLMSVALGVLLAFASAKACAAEPKDPEPGLPATRASQTTVPRGGVATPIFANGTLEGDVVDVCAKVDGPIETFGDDPQRPGKSIDYQSRVEAGTILAQIDPLPYAIRVDQKKAVCARAEAELAQAQAKLELAEAQWRRAQEQLKNKSISDSDFDVAKFNDKTAKATLAAAQASLAENKAALKEAELNLSYTTIKSPIKGVVIDRRVVLGQRVTASGNTPSLFWIVADAKKPEIWASVNEADIGRIYEEQPVHFTVDAYPGEVFAGKVEQIRRNATMTGNVVTYTVVVAIENPDLKLLPYLTARVQFDVQQRKSAP